MALSDLSFKLYTTDELITLFGDLKSLLHNTNLSDNPQDFVVYLGSLGSGGLDTEDRQLQALSDPGVDNIILTPTSIIPVWQASHAYTLGQSVRPTVANGYRFEVTTAGTSASMEPTWPTSGIGSVVSDGSVVWTLKSPTHPITELKLSLTEGGLAAATPGAALSLGSTLVSGTDNVTSIWIRVTNTVTIVSSNIGSPELGIYINEVREDSV